MQACAGDGGACPHPGRRGHRSKRLAELMGGAVGFRSVPSEGSEFWVDMPLGKAPSSLGQRQTNDN